MQYAFVIFFVLFIVLGVLTMMGKGVSVLLGGKKDTDDSEPVYDHKAISRFLSIVMFSLAVSALAGFLGYVVRGADWLVIVAPILFILILICALVFANTENRFKKQGARRYRK